MAILRPLAVLALSSLLALIPQDVRALDVSPDFSRDDSKAHAAISFGVNTASYVAMRRAGWDKTSSIFTAMALSISLGILKEIVDHPLDTEDIGANLTGVGASTVLVFTVDWF